MTQESAVRVVVRLRPMNERELAVNTLPVVTAKTNDRSVTVIKGSGARQQRSQFQFDNVFSSFSTQDEVYSSVISPVIKDVLNGYESTVFAYGQTGTGKTHTMEGDIENEEQQGVIPRSARAIFEELKHEKYTSHTVSVQYLEIYNEELCDLFVDVTKTGKDKTKLEIMDSKTGTFCKGLSEHVVESAADVLSQMAKAQTHRRIGETKMNKQSSRSHCLFTIAVKAKVAYPDGSMEVNGKLHMVDLAGSECAKSANLDSATSSSSAARERERMNINRSLLTLGRVISCLKEQTEKKNSTVRVPYRDSKLTRVLQESLGGRCKTVIIATLSPSDTAIEESISTLNYAQSANGIVNKPVATSYLTVGKGDGGQYSGESDAAGSQSLQHWHEMECKLQYMQTQMEEAQSALARKHLQIQEFQGRAETAEKKCEELTEDLKAAAIAVKRSAFTLKSTQNTEASLTTQSKELLSTLQTTIRDSSLLHSTLVEAVDQERATRSAALTHKDASLSLLSALSSISASLGTLASSSSASLCTSLASDASAATANLEQITSLVSDLDSLIRNHHEQTTTTFKDSIATTTSTLQNSTSGALSKLLSTFSDSEESLSSGLASSVALASGHRDTISSALHPHLETTHSDSLSSVTSTFSTILADLTSISTGLSDLSSTSSASASALSTTLAEINKAFSDLSVSHFSDVANLSESSVAAATSTLSSFAASNNHAEMQQHVASTAESTSAHSTEAEALHAAQAALLAEQKELIAAAQREQEEAHKAFTESVYSQMQAILSAEASKLKETVAARFSEQAAMSDKVTVASSAASSLATSFASAQAASTETVSTFVTAAIATDEAIVTGYNATIGQMNELSERQQAYQLSFSENVVKNGSAIEEFEQHAKAVVKGVDGVGASIEALSGIVGGEAKDAVVTELGAVKSSGEKALAAAASHTEAMETSLKEIAAPRPAIQKSVEAAGAQALTELAENIASINSASGAMCDESAKLTETFEAKSAETKEVVGVEKSRVETSKTATTAALTALVASHSELLDEHGSKVEAAVASTSHYADDVVQAAVEVPDAPPSKSYKVDSFLYSTAETDVVEAAFSVDEKDEERNAVGFAPVKVPVEVDLRDWVREDDVPKENAGGMGPARRRRSSVGGGARDSLGAGVLRDSTKANADTPPPAADAKPEVVAAKAANSPKIPKRGRKSVIPDNKAASRSAASKSPRPSTAPKPTSPTRNARPASARNAKPTANPNNAASPKSSRRQSRMSSASGAVGRPRVSVSKEAE
ncbi:hypothetical protein TeGR_g5245 [Tetraparma gracilis]|uniref:Kinesin motor domain-containing protein n=1 Tax=Tetraparma gracilis TaxID=2962635 RepID=A0ABQ6N7A2_9STRA|nr:hypothetical protein TeGR_g5245 [Tetraparma gracilis]